MKTNATPETIQSILIEIRELLIQVLARDSVGSKDVLKSKEVMTLLGCSESKLDSMRKQGIIPCSKIGGTYYYNREDIDKLLQSKK